MLRLLLNLTRVHPLGVESKSRGVIFECYEILPISDSPSILFGDGFETMSRDVNVDAELDMGFRV